MSNETKTIPLDAIHRDGWLMEANRQFFHPRGVALTLIGVKDADESKPKRGLADLLQWVRDHPGTPEEHKANIDQWIVDMRRGFVGFLEDFRADGGIEFGPSASRQQSDARREKCQKMHEAIMREEESLLVIQAVEESPEL